MVITAIAGDEAHAATVRAAQLAAAAKRITSIDTQPFLRCPGHPPGTRAATYHQNAASYLDLGEAIGKTLIELQNK